MPDSSPDDRRIRRRDAARVIVLAGREVLLQGDIDPGVPGSNFWQTPGGGVEADELNRAAAVRELEEETGLIVQQEDLEGPVAVRHLVRGYSDRILVQDEVFYRLRVERFDPVATGLTEDEQSRHVATEWYPLDALPSPTWPADLALIADWAEPVPLDLGSVEESTVPVNRPL